MSDVRDIFMLQCLLSAKKTDNKDLCFVLIQFQKNLRQREMLQFQWEGRVSSA